MFFFETHCSFNNISLMAIGDIRRETPQRRR